MQNKKEWQMLPWKELFIVPRNFLDPLDGMQQHCCCVYSVQPRVAIDPQALAMKMHSSCGLATTTFSQDNHGSPRRSMLMCLPQRMELNTLSRIPPKWHKP
eukprot:2338618-Amphidinium_carterae.1